MDTMNINALPGTKVIFAYPENGPSYEKEHNLKYLIVGNKYTVKETNVCSSYTELYLWEVPGKHFNSVIFKEVSNGLVE